MIKFALVGCGKIAKRHTQLLGENQIRNASLVAVCDKDIDRTTETSSQYNIPAYSCMHEMMKNEDIDVVVITTASGLHAQHTTDLAIYGKAIVVEKPMALTLEDADKMIEACDKHGVKLFIVKQNRFNLPVVKLKNAIDQGRFGKLVMGTVRIRWCRTQEYYDQDPWRGTWAYDGGVLCNQASHHLDLLEWIMGDVESVFAKGTTALANIEAEDTAIAALKFRNGALGIIEATTATRPKDLEGSISILGEHGSVEIGGFAANELKTWNFSEPTEEDKDTVNNHSKNPQNKYGFGHQAYYEHVVDCIHNETAQLVDGLQGRKSLKLINAIYESIETGNEVFLRFTPKYSKLGRL